MSIFTIRTGNKEREIDTYRRYLKITEEEKYGVQQVFITAHRGSLLSVSAVPQNTQLTNIFLHFLSLLRRERSVTDPIHMNSTCVCSYHFVVCQRFSIFFLNNFCIG